VVGGRSHVVGMFHGPRSSQNPRSAIAGHDRLSFLGTNDRLNNALSGSRNRDVVLRRVQGVKCYAIDAVTLPRHAVSLEFVGSLRRAAAINQWLCTTRH
jgi:hypothetical protein